MKFKDFWMNERPFDDDMKSCITHWHKYPLLYPKRRNTMLWIMDDWRGMFIILKDKLRLYRLSQNMERIG